MKTWVLIATCLFFVLSCSAQAGRPNVPPGFPPDFDMSPPEEGEETTEVTVEFEDDEPTPDAPPPSANIPDPPQETKNESQEGARKTSGATEPPAKGDKGDQGDKGDRGDTGPQGATGPQGIPGVNADLCSNIAGIQTQPGWKIWPQRYWSFRPKREKRVLSINRRGHLVCVTQRWINQHGLVRLR